MAPPNGRGVALPLSSGAACGGSRIKTQRWKATIGMRMGHQVRPLKRFESEGPKPRWAVSFDACASKRGVTWPRQVP
jgi:hypothetical protein